MSRRLDELSSAVSHSEFMPRTPGSVQYHCISSRVTCLQIIQKTSLVVITTTLVNLKTGICLFNTLILTNCTYNLIVNLIVTYLQVYVFAVRGIQTTSHLLSLNELTRTPTVD